MATGGIRPFCVSTMEDLSWLPVLEPGKTLTTRLATRKGFLRTLSHGGGGRSRAESKRPNSQPQDLC